MSGDHPDREPATVEECRQAIKLHEWELLRLVSELAERRRRVSEHRRRYENGRRACTRIWKRCRDQVEQIELLTELIRSSSDGLTIQLGERLKTPPAGLVILRQLEEIMDGADVSSELGQHGFFRRLAELQEFAKDFFDYAGVRLVYELGELLAQAQQEPQSMPTLLEKVAALHSRAGEWFDSE